MWLLIISWTWATYKLYILDKNLDHPSETLYYEYLYRNIVIARLVRVILRPILSTTCTMFWCFESLTVEEVKDLEAEDIDFVYKQD